ncbi:MAG: phenylalanine--tRNA ligase subunit beta [Ruminococcaceae bacterium]|nr:phenylalanine--tRNA ligase subunit beta [Oscillospiraceae bacterium]
MKFPVKWLNDYVDISDISIEKLAHEMTMSGSKVEGVENLGEEIQNVVVGKILSIEKHPDADKLVVCKVDVGEEVLQIVTGAKNVNEGDFVPVALHGSHLPGGITIKKGKLRGVESCGMLCSIGELNLTLEDVPYAIEDGILIFDREYPLGMDVKEIFSLNEDIIEFEITPNRADCFSVIGIAREAAVTFDKPFNLKTPVIHETNDKIEDFASVEVLDKENCMRYAARVVKNVKIGPSPKWLSDRLKLSGIRSINNIVDITNYVLLEYGQPMHAFDLDNLAGHKIIVRKANEGEVITTLDEQERKLDSSMLMICDSEKAVAVAGVMGGLNTEIEDTTKTLLFESACFYGANVRTTARKLGLRTEASSRYEKGLDPENVIGAINRACELVEMLGAGEVVSGIIDIDNSNKEGKVLPFRPDYINNFLGTDIPKEDMVKTLTAFEFKIDGDKVLVPSFRSDIEGEADLAEEVVRIYGYDKIEATPLRGETTQGIKTKDQKMADKIENVLIAQGHYEVMNFSFVSPDIFEKINTNDETIKNPVVILNPLGKDCSIMRTTLVASMMDTLSFNNNQRTPNGKFFEMARVYLPRESEKLPDEKKKVCLGMYGGYDFYDLKGSIEAILDNLNIKDYEFVAEGENTTFHPGRCARILSGDKLIGIMGEIHPTVCKNYAMSAKAYVAELDFDTLLSLWVSDVEYKPLPKFPAVTRDIAMLVDDSVTVGEIEKIIKKCSGKILEDVKLFDVYKGEQIESGKKSVAFSIVYRADDRTLTDDEITVVFDKIVSNLEKNLSAQLR